MAIKLGSIYGIPLFLDYSWFIILALIIYTVGFAIMPGQYPGLSQYMYLALGTLSAFLLFVSIVVHELAHSIIAKRNGLKIGKITLYLLGGVSEMTEEPPNSSLELRMSAAGPLTSLAIAGATYLAFLLSTNLNLSVMIQGPLWYSALFNLIIAGFNLIPAFPMDGGRVLRSIIWKFRGDMISSTRVASVVGRFFAYAMMFFGIIISFLNTALLFEGLWIILIGWFISSGAQNEYKQILIQRDIAELKARDMMTRDIDKVSVDLPLSEVSNLFSKDKQYALPVITGGELVGSITLKDLQDSRKKRKKDWLLLRVSDILIPRDKTVTVGENESAKHVLRLMAGNRFGAIFVLSDEPNASLIGIITRLDVIRTIQMQENYLKNVPQAPFGSERNISVELGMLFQILAPYEELQSDWNATFDPAELSLIEEQIVQLAANRQTKQFTFQSKKKGNCYLYLNHVGASKKSGLRYTIVVT